MTDRQSLNRTESESKLWPLESVAKCCAQQTLMLWVLIMSSSITLGVTHSVYTAFIIWWMQCKPKGLHLVLLSMLSCWLVGLLFYIPVNSYGNVGMVSSPNYRPFSWASLNRRLTSTFTCNWQQPFLNELAEGRRMTVEIISWSTPHKQGTGLGSNLRPLDQQ